MGTEPALQKEQGWDTTLTKVYIYMKIKAWRFRDLWVLTAYKDSPFIKMNEKDVKPICSWSSRVWAWRQYGSQSSHQCARHLTLSAREVPKVHRVLLGMTTAQAGLSSSGPAQLRLCKVSFFAVQSAQSVQDTPSINLSVWDVAT